MNVIERIEALFATRGHTLYEGRRAEGVTALAHALQCAQLAEWAGSPSTGVAAALLHDIGHFVDSGPQDDDDDDDDDTHEERAPGLLSLDFGREVLEPIRLHVQAKRYLVALEPGYTAQLSSASRHSLLLQGGAMGADEQHWFEGLPFAEEAIALRRFDDAAKTPGKLTPPLAYYLALLDEVRLQPVTAPKLAIGSLELS